MRLPLVVSLLLVLAALPAAAGAAAPTPLTPRQQANAICQRFFAQATDAFPEVQRPHERWSHARRRIARTLRRTANASLATDAQLAAVHRPAAEDARWRRMIAVDRAGARMLLRIADRVQRAAVPSDGSAAFGSASRRYFDLGTRFTRLARELHLAGCVKRDPTVDIGRDRSASPAQRAQAAALARIGARVGRRVLALRPQVSRRVGTMLHRGPCARALRFVRGEPVRVQNVVERIFIFEILRTGAHALRWPLARLGDSLRAASLHDPALVRARPVLLEYQRWLMRVARTPSLCSALADWRAAGSPKGEAPQRPRWFTHPGIEHGNERPTLFALGRRMRALGAPAAGVRPLMYGDPFGFGGALDAAKAFRRSAAPGAASAAAADASASPAASVLRPALAPRG